MTWGAPWTLVLLPVWIWLFVRFARTQRRALRWIGANVGPRFRRRLTTWSPTSFRLHLAFLAVLAACLVAAATGPAWLGGDARTKDGGRLLLALDASASMRAADVEIRGREEPAVRHEVAKELAGELAESLSGWEVALASWSGVATVHLPMQLDAALVRNAARDLRPHSLYRSTGTSFESVLDVALRFHDPEENALQVLLISDGEMPRPEAYDEALAALREAGVVVHAVGLGGETPIGMVVWDPRDLGKPQDDRRVIREFHTTRVDEHLARIARATGGRFLVPGLGTLENGEGGEAPVAELADRLAGRLREVEVDAGAERRQQARHDLGVWLLALFLAGLLLDLHVLGRGRGGTPPFRLEAIGRKAATHRGVVLLALVALLPASCGEGDLWDALGGPVWKAHRSNEKGIRQTVLGRHGAAETSFLRSAAYGIEPETPVYNHARSRILDDDFAGAHELNEEALELAPSHHAARFNDGVVLYRWGVAEAHPRGCELERTLDLWKSALGRFDDVAASATDPDLRRRAVEQAESIRRETAWLKRLVAEPPEACRTPPPPPQSPPPPSPPPSEAPDPSGGGGDGGDGGGGGGDGSGVDGDGGGGEGGRGSEGDGGLSDEELEQLLGEVERIRSQARQEGKFHLRSAAEQIDEESFGNPDEVWW